MNDVQIAGAAAICRRFDRIVRVVYTCIDGAGTFVLFHTDGDLGIGSSRPAADAPWYRARGPCATLGAGRPIARKALERSTRSILHPDWALLLRLRDGWLCCACYSLHVEIVPHMSVSET